MKPINIDGGERETTSPGDVQAGNKKAATFLDGHKFLAGKDSVIGMVRYHKVRNNESLIEIARMFDLGFNEISDANPGTDPFIPPAGLRAEIPAEWVLPDVKVRQGIIINISDMRLYFFPQRNSEFVYTFPIGIGDEGKETPVGRYRIIQKINQPYWHVPKSIKEEKPELPDVVPPGPDNPLGSHALRLSAPGILIHGTNRPWGIGRRVSHGCIHLYPEDIPWLFDHVKKGTRVTIVNQPVKVGIRGNRVYLEVHDVGKMNYLGEALTILGRKNLIGRIDSARINRVIREKDGVPAVISK
jgi:L,D-transpeptidase ErfK/SrfK